MAFQQKGRDYPREELFPGTRVGGHSSLGGFQGKQQACQRPLHIVGQPSPHGSVAVLQDRESNEAGDLSSPQLMSGTTARPRVLSPCWLLLPCVTVFWLSLQNVDANPNNHGNQFACQCGSAGPSLHRVKCLSGVHNSRKASILTGAHWSSRALLKAPYPSLTNFMVYGRREQPFPPRCWLGLRSVTELTASLSLRPVLPSLGLTILEVSCNMELPHGGEGWQQLRQGYLPPEFTAGEWGFRASYHQFLASGVEW